MSVWLLAHVLASIQMSKCLLSRPGYLLYTLLVHVCVMIARPKCIRWFQITNSKDKCWRIAKWWKCVWTHTHTHNRGLGNMPPWFTDIMQAHFWIYFVNDNNNGPGKSFFPYFFLMNCKGAGTFGHKRAANTRTRKCCLQWERNVWVYDATQSLTETITYISTKPLYQILTKWN